MLLTRKVLDGVVAGTITCVFRRWRRPTVRTGGTLRTAVGILAIDAVIPITADQITEADAHAGGYESREAVFSDLEATPASRPDTQLYKIRLHLAGPDPRVALREDGDLGPAELDELRRRLQRMDAASTHGPWTRDTLRLIDRRPNTRASELAGSLGRDKASFKADVRKLKNLGLTESLPVGYRLPPRGRTVLDHLDQEQHT